MGVDWCLVPGTAYQPAPLLRLAHALEMGNLSVHPRCEAALCRVHVATLLGNAELDTAWVERTHPAAMNALAQVHPPAGTPAPGCSLL